MAKRADLADLDEEEAQAAPSIRPRDFISALWRARWLGVQIVAVLGALAVLYVAFLAKPQYQAAAVVGAVPNSSATPAQGTAGLLAGLAGATGSDPSQAMLSKYTQVLTSTRLAARLEKDHAVLETIIPGWDPVSRRWVGPPVLPPVSQAIYAIKGAVGLPWKPPTVQDLSDWLNLKLSVDAIQSGDSLLSRTQYYNVTLKGPDRDYAIKLLGWILDDADAIVREDQAALTKSRIAYLTSALHDTTEVGLRDYLGQILAGQEQTLMTLKADKRFSYDLVDSPSASISPVGFTGPVLVALSLLLGAMLYAAIMFALVQGRVARGALQGSQVLDEPYPNPVMALAAWLRRRLFRGRRENANQIIPAIGKSPLDG